MDLKEKIKLAMGEHRRVSMAPGPVPASVLIPIFLKEGEYHLLFTKRTEHMLHHGGQISFPRGGCNHEDRDTLHTALRETWDEVGYSASAR